MITKPELQELLQSTETYRVERTNPTSVTQGVPQDDTQSDTQNNLVTHLGHKKVTK